MMVQPPCIGLEGVWEGERGGARERGGRRSTSDAPTASSGVARARRTQMMGMAFLPRLSFRKRCSGLPPSVRMPTRVSAGPRAGGGAAGAAPASHAAAAAPAAASAAAMPRRDAPAARRADREKDAMRPTAEG
jgi:hypothetical protein